jgi:hypothetical protein
MPKQTRQTVLRRLSPAIDTTIRKTDTARGPPSCITVSITPRAPLVYEAHTEDKIRNHDENCKDH